MRAVDDLQRAVNALDHAVHCADGAFLVGEIGLEYEHRLLHDDVENRSDKQPGDSVADDRPDDEGRPFRLAELAVFDGAGDLLGSQTGDQRGDCRSEDPAPPRRTVADEVGQRVADEGDQAAAERTEDDGEEAADAVSDLEIGLRNR